MLKAACALTVMLLLPQVAMATTYYVDNTNGSANNSNAGTNSALPWLTLSRCTGTGGSAIAAGDTCSVIAGSYNERLNLTANGTIGSRIVYSGSGGAKFRGFDGGGNYTTVQGFEITQEGFSAGDSRMIDVTGGAGWLLYNNTIHGSTADYACVRFLGVTIASLIIRGNTVHHCGNAISTGSQPAIQVGSSTNTLIETNTIHDVGDFQTLGANTKIVIRNNTWGPSTGTSTYHVDGVQCGDDQYMLVENNAQSNNGGTDNHFALCQDSGGRNFVLRFNPINAPSGTGTVDCGRGANTTTPGCAIYNNTFANNNLAVGNGVIGFVDYISHMTSTGNVSRNNIFYSSTNVATSPYDTGTVDKDYDLYYLGGSPAETHSINSDPSFVSASSDLHLQAGSPAINAGSCITTAVGTGSSSTTLTVANPQAFQDGWAGVNPDCIAIGTVGNTACIVASSINYSTGAMTLDASLTWSNGANVWLYKRSDGTIVLLGSAPDIGAYEFDSVVPVPGNSGTVTTASVTSSSMTLNWTKATDETSPQNTLQYEVCRSTSNNITSVAQCEAATIVGQFATDIATFNSTGLAASTSYYFNVVVKDQAGNKTAYTPVNQTTSAAGGSTGAGRTRIHK